MELIAGAEGHAHVGTVRREGETPIRPTLPPFVGVAGRRGRPPCGRSPRGLRPLAVPLAGLSPAPVPILGRTNDGRTRLRVLVGPRPAPATMVPSPAPHGGVLGPRRRPAPRPLL